jgi:hypothetical protein
LVIVEVWSVMGDAVTSEMMRDMRKEIKIADTVTRENRISKSRGRGWNERYVIERQVKVDE